MRTLYSIDKKGKIRVFKGEVGLVGPTLPNTAVVHTYSGLLNGELIHRLTHVVKGKQGRTINQQAQFDLDSLINEKIDEGYKSEDQLLARYELLSGTIPFLTKNDSKYILELFSKCKITYNTNAYWLPLPMLAEKWKQHKAKVTYPVLVQPKLNGVRCIALYQDQKVLLLSRGGQFYIMPQIQAALTPFFQSNPTVQLDGELYNHGMPLQEIVGRVKVEDPKQFDRKLCIEYWIYDLADDRNIQFSRITRKQIWFGDSLDFIKINSIKSLVTKNAINEQEVQNFHNQFVSEGYEGAIVRDPNAFYQFGFRDQCLLKVKEFLDEEFEIIGYEVDPNKGIESFVFILDNNQVTNNGDGTKTIKTFKARPTGTLEEKDIWRQNISKYIGQKATVRFQERTKDKLPHQAHVRSKNTIMLMEAIRNYE